MKIIFTLQLFPASQYSNLFFLLIESSRTSDTKFQNWTGTERPPDPAAPSPQPAVKVPPTQRHVPHTGGCGGHLLQLQCSKLCPASAGHGAGVPETTGTDGEQIILELVNDSQSL